MLRQGQLTLEDEWPTQAGWFRIYTSVTGMVVTDASRVAESVGALKPGTTIKEFANRLAGRGLRATRTKRKRSSSDGSQWGMHWLDRIERAKKFAVAPDAAAGGGGKKPNPGALQRVCKVCGAKTCFSCSWCAGAAICSPDTSLKRGGCWERHMVENFSGMSNSGDMAA